MIKKFLGFLIILVIIFLYYFQYRYENAIGICEMIGDKKEFYQKLDQAKSEDNATVARILFMYYAHRCAEFTNDEKKNLKNIMDTIQGKKGSGDNDNSNSTLTSKH